MMDVFTLKRSFLLVVIIMSVSVDGDICDLDPCHSTNHVCRSLPNKSDYECVCREGCRGNDCSDCSDLDTTSSACNPNPCQRDCRCFESCQHAGGYFCRSDSGFLGKNCTVPVPEVRCEQNRMILRASESFVSEYDMGLRNSYVMITPSFNRHTGSECEMTAAKNGAYEMVIPLPFKNCGTVQNETDDGMVFSNQMWFNRRLSNAMFDMPIPAAEFRCTYNRVYKVVTSLKPVVTTPGVISSEKDIFPEVSLCKVPSCPAACPTLFQVSNGAFYTVGEMIHVSLSLDSGSFTTGVVEMYLSCSRDPESDHLVDLVRGGCNAGSDLPTVIASTFSSNTACISLQTPLFQQCNEFFIHAELQSCARGDTEMCPGSDSLRCRSKRSKRSTVPVVVLGPLIVLNGSVGEPSITISGMEDYDLDILHDFKEESVLKLQRSATGDTEMCPGSDSLRCRSKRSKRSTVPVVVLGPLIVLNGSVGEPSITISGMEDYDLDILHDFKEESVLKLQRSATGDTMLITFCFAAVLFVALALYYYRRRNSSD